MGINGRSIEGGNYMLKKLYGTQFAPLDTDSDKGNTWDRRHKRHLITLDSSASPAHHVASVVAAHDAAPIDALDFR